jgi:hypothetical protein
VLWSVVELGLFTQLAAGPLDNLHERALLQGRSLAGANLVPTTNELTCRKDTLRMRHNLYTAVHKAIRHELCNLLSALGSSNGADDAWNEIPPRLERLGRVLNRHAHHEEAIIHPSLERDAPALAAELAVDHAALDREFLEAMRELHAVNERPVGPSRQEQLADGYLCLASFAGRYLAHMAREEYEVMPALWRSLSDAQLRDLHIAVMSTMQPEDVSLFLALTFPAINHDERVELLSGFRPSLPPEMFQGIMVLAKSVLSPLAFSATCTAIGA